MVNVQTSTQQKLLTQAALSAGLPKSSLVEFLENFPTGKSLNGIPGVTANVLAIAKVAFKNAYAHTLRYFFQSPCRESVKANILTRILTLTSIAFGIVGVLAVICCEDIDQEMNDNIEVFLENDHHANKNKFH